MNIYIIQNMDGKTTEEIEEERKPVTEYYRSRNATILQNVGFIPDSNTCEELNIRAKIEACMSRSDLCVYMSGWKSSSRCQMENDIVSRYNLASYFPTWC